MVSSPTGGAGGRTWSPCTEMRARLRVDSHQERLLAVLDLQNDCGFDWVPIFVKLVGACHAREGRILHGIPDVRALDRAGSLECVEEQSCSVIRKSTH